MISIIIVNYKSTSVLSKLIDSLSLIQTIIGEIIVVNNYPKNSNLFLLRKKNKKIIIIQNKENKGFAKAVNQGIKTAKNEFVLLLNPDTLIVDKSIISIYNKIKRDEKIGVIGGRIEEYDNTKRKFTATLKPGFLTAIFEFTILKKIFPNNRFTNEFWVEKYNKILDVLEVDSLCGAFLLFRKKTKGRLNLFDERYFLYMEDVDFCINNFRKKGYKVIFDPNSIIKHIGGFSSGSKYKIKLKYWYISRKKYFQKNLNFVSGFILGFIFTVEEKALFLYHYLKHEPTE